MTRPQIITVLLLVLAAAISLTVWLGAALTFTGLSDTPGGYSGHAGKAVVVRQDETGLDYAAFPSGSGTVGLSRHTVTATVASLNFTGDAITTGSAVNVLSSSATVFSISVVVEVQTLNGLTTAMHSAHYTLMTQACPSGWSTPSQPSSGTGAESLVVDDANYCVVNQDWDALGNHLMVRIGRSGNWITVLPYETTSSSNASSQQVDIEVTIWENAAF